MRCYLIARLASLIAFSYLCLAQSNLTDFGGSCELALASASNSTDLQQTPDLGGPNLCPQPPLGSIPIRLYRQAGIKMRVIMLYPTVECTKMNLVRRIFYD